MKLNTFKEAQEEFMIAPPDWFEGRYPKLRDIYAVGSRRTCSPPPMDTDDDYLVYASNDPELKTASLALTADGWQKCPVGKYKFHNGDGEFISFRREEKNLIVTPYPAFIEKFLLASHVAKDANILSKSGRVSCFNMVFAEWEANLKEEQGDLTQYV